VQEEDLNLDYLNFKLEQHHHYQDDVQQHHYQDDVQQHHHYQD
jgi:hypothetical protein